MTDSNPNNSTVINLNDNNIGVNTSTNNNDSNKPIASTLVKRASTFMASNSIARDKLRSSLKKISIINAFTARPALNNAVNPVPVNNNTLSNNNSNVNSDSDSDNDND